MSDSATSAGVPRLSEADGRAALALARRAVAEAVEYRRLLQDFPRDGIFIEKRGLFVTLRVLGSLRGCIGVIEPEDSLAETLVQCAIGAALEDPRFSPLSAEELPCLTVEISLLSPLALVRAEEIEIGRHGLLVMRDHHRGVLLPQVALEHRLDREQFLAETCRKAGLAGNAWGDSKTFIFAFTTEHLVEGQLLALRERL